MAPAIRWKIVVIVPIRPALCPSAMCKHATIALHCIVSSQSLLNLLKPTCYMMHQQVQHSKIAHSACTVFMCFVLI
jgi:hypothetical protein